MQTSNTLDNLQGEVYQWPQQMNYKFDLTIVKIFHAFHAELEGRIKDLDVKATARQQAGISVIKNSLDNHERKIEELLHSSEKQTGSIAVFLESLEQHKLQTNKDTESMQKSLHDRIGRLDNRIGTNQSNVNNQLASFDQKLGDQASTTKHYGEAKAEPPAGRVRQGDPARTYIPGIRSDDHEVSSDFFVDRRIPKVNDDTKLVDRAKSVWFLALSYNDLRDHHARRMKNLASPVNPRLPQLSTSTDPNIWDKMTQVQTALRAAMSPYENNDPCA